MNTDIILKIILENKIKIFIFFVLTIVVSAFYYINFNTVKYQNNISLYSSINIKEKSIENILVNLNYNILNGQKNLQDLTDEFKNNFIEHECSIIQKIFSANFIDLSYNPSPSLDSMFNPKFIDSILHCSRDNNFISNLITYQNTNKELFTVNISNKDVVADIHREFNFFKLNFKDIQNIMLSIEEVENKSFVNMTMVINTTDKKLSLDESEIIVEPLVKKLKELFKEELIDLINDVEIELNREINNIKKLIDPLNEDLNLLRENLYKNILADLNIYYESKKFSNDMNNFWLYRVETDIKPTVFIQNTIDNIIELEKKDFNNNPVIYDIKNYRKNVLNKNYNIIFNEINEEIKNNEQYLLFENIGVNSSIIFNTTPIILLTFVFFANLFFFTSLLIINFIRNNK